MVRMLRRGQAALEFLTTYGWAFMVILVMIGALAYFGVLNPRRLIPDTCTVAAGFECRDYQILTDTISVSLVNKVADKDLDVTNTGASVVVDDDQGGNVPVTLPCTVTVAGGGNVVPNQGSFDVSCDITTALLAGQKEKFVMRFDYMYSGGSSFTHQGEVTLTATVG